MNRSVRWLPPLPFRSLNWPRCRAARRGPAFDGHVTERETLARMLTGPGAPEGAVVITDRGVATRDNPRCPSNTACRCPVISRAVDSDEAGAITASSRDRVNV